MFWREGGRAVLGNSTHRCPLPVVSEGKVLNSTLSLVERKGSHKKHCHSSSIAIKMWHRINLISWASQHFLIIVHYATLKQFSLLIMFY